MADIRILEHRRKWNTRVDTIVGVGEAAGAVSSDIALGVWSPGQRALLLKAYLVVGATIAVDSATVDTVEINLHDYKAAGTGVINVSDGVCVISTGTLTSATAAFVTNEVNVGDQITLASGTPATNAGVYRVVSVDSATQLTLDTTFSVASTAEDVDMTGLIGTAGNTTAALTAYHKYDMSVDGYIVAEGSVIGVEQEWTVAGTPGAVVLVAPTIIIEWIPLPAV